MNVHRFHLTTSLHVVTLKICFSQEFARAIEGFEERLLSVEMNVQKEIVQIKNIAESLLAASKQSSSLHSKH